MDEDTKLVLLRYRKNAQELLDCLNGYCEMAASLTGESDMTADYIWGNCTLEQLEAHLESVKVEA